MWITIEDKLYSRLEMKYRPKRGQVWVIINNILYSRLEMKYRVGRVEMWITRR